MIDEKFSRWAKSFSGCDGGNLRGSYWLCGIEYGGGDTEDSLIFDEVDVPKFVGMPHWVDRDAFLKYQYNWKAMKVFAALAGKSVSGYTSFFEEHRCFDQDSEYFKLNLYPIGFKNTSHASWTEWHSRKTGFATKQEYLD
ncbi:MAG TPA: hypothetical protein VK629_16385 [Steroidobacteraceae bacterium]|nr:hypothetical protein [Steroidobacteraceae bacterium]